ncbi:hypothetical protein BELINDA_183 [Bacillus phage Belinda]|uniref:hypothetical protein n=1 Tax=Bacillus phage Belinda TaxID=1852564 RepID=UPI0007F14627|nr:hypothetical protein BI039_gp195 [Bacillus phage Belinda]ANM46109.1 hypothetical protein BELINDA_183 [Bacillus phage Belinda]
MDSKRCGICNINLSHTEKLVSRKEVCYNCGVRGGLNVIDEDGNDFIDRIEIDLRNQMQDMIARLARLDRYREDKSWILVKQGDAYFVPLEPTVWRSEGFDE